MKIGFTSGNTANGRLGDLQTANAERLAVVRFIANADRSVERQLHAHYAPLHINGEWFHYCETMLTLEPHWGHCSTCARPVHGYGLKTQTYCVDCERAAMRGARIAAMVKARSQARAKARAGRKCKNKTCGKPIKDASPRHQAILLRPLPGSRAFAHAARLNSNQIPR